MPHSNKYNIEKLLEAQLTTLANKKVSSRIIRKLAEKKHKLIEQAADQSNESWSFIPVIPLSQISAETQMSMLIHANQCGLIKMNCDGIYDLDPIDEPYYITKISEGSEYLGIAAVKAVNLFLSINKNPLTVAECIALALHTNLLNRHNAIALDSRYKMGDEILIIGILTNRPLLKHVGITFADHSYGIPYHGGRLI